MKKSDSKGQGEALPSQPIDARIKELSDWRGKTLARIRTLIKQTNVDRRDAEPVDVPVKQTG